MYVERSPEEIEALMRECLAELTIEELRATPDKGVLRCKEIISTVMQEVAEKVCKGLVTKREFGLCIVNSGLICLAADLDNKRGNNPQHRPERSAENQN